jgi:hypothetical protein
MLSTLNLSSLKVDIRNKKDTILTYLFDTGTERVMKISTVNFLENMSKTVVPYNIAFLGQCEVIELR